MQGKVSVSINNLDEFKKLLVLADGQAKQLRETLRKLDEFELKTSVVKS